MKKIYTIVFLIICFWWVNSQYYYFDTGTTNYPYQQGCSESLLVRVSTESHVDWAKAGRFHLVLDPQYVLYSTSDVRNTLFEASTTTFFDRSSESSPSWKPWSNFSILQIDRKNNLYSYKWINGIYWVISFVPRYVPTTYFATFSMEYNWEIWTPNSTVETTLSSPWWTEIINPTKQYQFMTWTYPVLQQPCVDDDVYPFIFLLEPTNWGTKKSNIGINIQLADVGGASSNVPYVWTGGNVWTWNIWWIDTQYGIDISSLQITLSGNGQTRTFTSWTYATPSEKTWQFLDKNYSVSIPSEVLFDYWIEKRIDLSVRVRDRKWLLSTQSISFNHPKGPELVAGTRFPAVGASFVNYDAPIRFGVQDDWAGVDSGSIVVTLSGINGTSYGPYVFSGNMLNLSGLSSDALQPNWLVEVSNHVDFPASWTIGVSVSVRDMVGNQWNISDYSFITRASCSQLWCCDDKYIQYKNISSLFARNTLIVQGGLNPIFSVSTEGTWYIDCGLINQGMLIYRWVDSELEPAEVVGFFDIPNLRIMGNNVKAIISWSTLILQKIFDHWSLDWWGWGWWWVRFERDNCPDGDNSPSYYDGICEGGAHSAGDICPVEGDEYSQELIDAFQFAYGLGVTTMCPIEKADITWNLSRKHLAKMITEYAVTIVWLYPDVTKKWCDLYDDIEDQSSEMKFYSKIVCQLWLMGLESDGIEPLKSFDPNAVVTRAQFGTILSRLVFGDAYNIKEGESFVWYQKHLKALKENKIMNKIENPDMIEMRWWVMLMLQRTFETWIIDRYRMLHNANNSIRIIYDF